MKILTVDIGTGTQDIYLYNSSLGMENNLKLVVPSPTMMVRQQIRQATQRGEAILLEGVTMGGGPCAWAVEDHLRGGLAVFATPDAARTLNDDLDKVSDLGVRVISDDEVMRLPASIRRVEMRDFDFPAIGRAFQSFGVEMRNLNAVSVAVFDHGNAPPEISDRKFRFDYLDQRIRQLNRLSAFAYRAEDVPDAMTRLKSVATTAEDLDFPLVIMDTAPAAILGAMLDWKVSSQERVLVANIGNFHTLAFRLGKSGVEGLFEHHTGFVDVYKLNILLRALADGSLRNESVFDDQGHGALVYEQSEMALGEGDYDVVVTGPRRSMFKTNTDEQNQTLLRPYFPSPFGDMMISGCFGLLAATADVLPELAGPIHASLYHEAGSATAPWDAS